MDISIVIVSYNVREFLRGAIESVERSLRAGGLTGEILIVDNDSSDGSAAMVRDEYPQVRLWALGENLGFGRANNLAMREASGTYMLILNPDTIVGEDTLRTMYDFMQKHPEAGLAGCKLLNGDGSFQLSCRRGFPTPWASFTKLFGLASLFPKTRLFAGYNLTYLPDDETYEIDALGGAFMMFSRPAFEATGGFDEDYFMYGEDIDLCYRTKQAGFKVYYVASTATIHFKGESTKRSAINEVNVFYEAMHIFVKKNYGRSLLFSALLRLGILLRTILALAKKHRGAVLLAVLDYLTAVCGVLLGTRLLMGRWLALPQWDYPAALVVPPLLVVALLAVLGAYAAGERRRAQPIVLAMPAMLIALSSLTYFFKEFPASRVLVISVTATTGGLLLLERILLRLFDRMRWGGGQATNPVLSRTLIVGTGAEAQRIAALLARTRFLRRFDVVGFIDTSLVHVGEEPVAGTPILGDLMMMGKVIRDHRISEVIFASDAVPYMDMLLAMQRISSEVLSLRVNFSMVPTASDVLLGKHRIELLAPSEPGGLAVMPLENNLQPLSQRALKRLFDVTVGVLGLPVVWAAAALGVADRGLPAEWRAVLVGRRTFVGVAGEEARLTLCPKPGLTSLAAVVGPKDLRPEDLHQLDQYYAQNRSLAMDLEILWKYLRQERP